LFDVRYMLVLIGEEGGYQDATPEEMQAEMGRWAAYGNEATENGAFVCGEGLQESAAATTVRFKDGDTTVTDGPFAETKEQIGGFYVLECKDLDEALEYARKIPFQNGSVEVRPVMDYSAFDYEGPEAQQGATRS
jgi:hypothetical protein